MKALRVGFKRSIVSRHSRVTSTGETLPFRISSDISAMERKFISRHLILPHALLFVVAYNRSWKATDGQRGPSRFFLSKLTCPRESAAKKLVLYDFLNPSRSA